MSELTVSSRIGFTKPPRGSALFFISPMAVRKADEIFSTITVANSTTQTTLGTLDVPSLTYSAQGASRAIVTGQIRNHVSAGATVVLRAKATVSGTTVTLFQSSALALSTSVNSRLWQAQIAIIGTTLSTQLRSWSDLQVSTPSTRQISPQAHDLNGYATISVPNSTAAVSLKFTAQLSAASTGLTASVAAGLLETIG